MKSNLTPAEALAVILEQIQPLGTEIPSGTAEERLAAMLGRTLAAGVVSTTQLPPFDNSAMDGYAVLAGDTAGASEVATVRLRQLEVIGAGEVARQSVEPGTCLKIMTGAPVPAGADAVIMREETAADGEFVKFLAPAVPGQNIRRAGSDVRDGETVLRAGDVIGPAQWSMLAALGAYNVQLFRRPQVALLVTGEELAAPGESLRPGQIRESNSFALRALVEECGAEVVTWRRTGDTTAELEAALREAVPQADVVITSGGVSAGDFDPVRDVLHEKAKVHFWKVAMKPGKPVMFADFQGTPVFGLPGNPVSVMVAFEVFVRPALLKMGGRRRLNRPVVPAILEQPYRSTEGRAEFVRARLRFETGQWRASFQGDQGSGRLSTMVGANALLEIAPEITSITVGQEIPARLLHHSEVD